MTDAPSPDREHYVGIAGSGMSALAQYRAMAGLPTSGSDRSFDAGDLSDEAERLASLGIAIHPQDGHHVDGAARLIASTAVEAAIPDLVAARDAKIPVVHRADVLAEHLAGGSSVGIAGTSGKSTVTAMVFTILQAAGRDPGLITGGDLVALRERGVRGNAWRGSGPVVAEVDESDGTLVRHAPSIGVILNLHRDHMDETEVIAQFRTFKDRTRDRVVVNDDAALASLRPGSLVCGFGPDSEVRGTDLRAVAGGSSFDLGGVRVAVPIPGAHNASNALSAIAAAAALDVPVSVAAQALASYAGVKRRYERVGAAHGVRVVDDFAHNPTKIAATLRAATSEAPRVLALFQPHGFAPARFMRAELAATIPPLLRPKDRLWIAEIHYAGGTARRDVSSRDLVEDLRKHGATADYVADRDAWPAQVALAARAGDLVLVMGARDPGLPRLATRVVELLEAAPPTQELRSHA